MAVRLGWHSSSSHPPEAVCAGEDSWLCRVSSELEIDKSLHTPGSWSAPGRWRVPQMWTEISAQRRGERGRQA